MSELLIRVCKGCQNNIADKGEYCRECLAYRLVDELARSPEMQEALRISGEYVRAERERIQQWRDRRKEAVE